MALTTPQLQTRFLAPTISVFRTDLVASLFRAVTDYAGASHARSVAYVIVYEDGCSLFSIVSSHFQSDQTNSSILRIVDTGTIHDACATCLVCPHGRQFFFLHHLHKTLLQRLPNQDLQNRLHLTREKAVFILVSLRWVMSAEHQIFHSNRVKFLLRWWSKRRKSQPNPFASFSEARLFQFLQTPTRTPPTRLYD